MKMLERAARAACEVDCGAWDAEAFYDELALATIRAIREPDEEVIEAMAERFARTQECWDTADCDADACECRKSALAIWQAGIDKIVEDRG